MDIEFDCIRYLTNHAFIRNASYENFVQDNNFFIDLPAFICYCVGIIDGERVVHTVRFIGQSQSPGVTSYFIEWFNSACFTVQELQVKVEPFESLFFWIHSGVALRKNFFLFEDRMSLLKSSFIYDKKRSCFYRLIHLLPFLQPRYMDNQRFPIYSSPTKVSFNMKRIKKIEYIKTNNKLGELQKNLKKVIKNHNSFRYIEIEYPRLFEEINNIIKL